MTQEKTDWNAYYAKPSAPAHLTRRITRAVLLDLIRHLMDEKSSFSICEIGGANSFFADAILAKIPISRYHIIDNNVYGLSQLAGRFGTGGRVSWESCDVLDGKASTETFDLVLSVGLIEHFDAVGTREAVAFHARRMKADGRLIVTFPTPTWLYRTTRFVIEVLGKWRFPDERPLQFSEVEGVLLDADLRLLSRRLNWGVVLTQGVVAAERMQSETVRGKLLVE